MQVGEISYSGFNILNPLMSVRPEFNGFPIKPGTTVVRCRNDGCGAPG